METVSEDKPSWRRRLFGKLSLVAQALIFLGLFSLLTFWEIRTSTFQSLLFSRLNRHMTFELKAADSGTTVYPGQGPADIRLGYALLGDLKDNLKNSGFTEKKHAVSSFSMRWLMRAGVFPPYDEKVQAGLTITDDTGADIYTARFPGLVYDSFDSIPRPVVNALLFIEDRNILNTSTPYKNPAVEWDRFGKAIIQLILKKIGLIRDNTIGGSTLPTQFEKYRHSPEGVTKDPGEKIKQMMSASLRAYRNGRSTIASRKKIVLDYINSVPMAAYPGYGEVNGLADGLMVWYGADFDRTNAVLGTADFGGKKLPSREALKAYKQVISLFIAHRRPSFYLLTNSAELNRMTDSYLRLMAREKLISEKAKEAMLKTALAFPKKHAKQARWPFIDLKAVNSIRTYLLRLLGTDNLYGLDRLDLGVSTMLNKKAQTEVTDLLKKLRTPSAFGANKDVSELQGLYHGDPAGIIYSFTLYERGDSVNLLRVQTDNFDQPLDINQGTKLDLGSTAKLRTLITYLDIVADLHGKYAALKKKDLAKVRVSEQDKISRWAVDYLTANPGRELRAMLEAALDRRYSANPEEKFFTGSGLHTFENFSDEENYLVLTVREALHRSTNLVFIRLMRDIARYYSFNAEGSTTQFLDKFSNPYRNKYLEKFADREGQVFINRFYKKYSGADTGSYYRMMTAGSRPTPRRASIIFRSFRPKASARELDFFIKANLPDIRLTSKLIEDLFEQSAPGRWTLADRGFIAHVHPLELWTAAYLMNNPKAKRSRVIRDSSRERQEVYKWLFKTRNKNAQDSRIRSLIEIEAFLGIHQQWKKMGYPFESLVPSYATSIGSSADKPAALAEMMGIIANGGVRYPTRRINRLHFAAGTPYETVFEPAIGRTERVLPEEVADVVKETIIGVVEKGTARRVKGAFKTAAGDTVILCGGKTGTGDHRFEVFGAGGKLISSRIVNRTATFAFVIGDRWFGTVVAFVPGKNAENYKFTSALPVQILKILAPSLMPVINSVPKDPLL